MFILKESHCSWPHSNAEGGFLHARIWLLWLLSLKYKTLHLCLTVLEDHSTAQIWSSHCWTPVAGTMHWAQCQNILLMRFFQLLVVCDLLNDSVWCRHGVSNLACPISGCVTASSNLRQQNPPTPSLIYNHVLFNEPFSPSHRFMEANVLWCRNCQSWKCPWCNYWAALPFPSASLDADSLCHFMPVILRHARCGTFYWFTM